MIGGGLSLPENYLIKKPGRFFAARCKIDINCIVVDKWVQCPKH